MPSLLLDTLLDEDTSEELARRLSADGHDVERVVAVPELGDGVDDAEVEAYAERNEMVIVTHDEGIYEEYEGKEGPLRVIWITAQQRYEPYEKRQMIENFLDTVGGDSSLSDLPSALPLTPAFDY